MLDFLYHFFNYIVAFCYFCIFMLIFAGLLRQKAFGRNILGSATSGIFFTCSLGHLLHATTSHLWGSSWEAGVQVIVDGWTVLPAITYLVLRRKYGLIISGPDMINEYRSQIAEQSAQLKVMQEFEQLKDDFIAMASHELRTPLTVIKGYTQILFKRFSEISDPKTLNAVTTITQQTERMTSLVNMLLDVSRIQSGKFGLRLSTVDLSFLLKEIIGRLQITSPRHHLNIKLLTSVPLSMRVDIERFEQLVTNLVVNAVKYSPDADQVDICLETRENQVFIHVTDYGIGMANEDLSKVFERFYRSPEVRNSSKEGLGLGLYICAEIVRASNGKISVVSQPGKGSTFTVQLPYPADSVGEPPGEVNVTRSEL